MKRWQIVYGLPLEVWVDIFSYPWITRKEFGQLVDKIGNFKFAENAQFFLHEWGKQKLGSLHFDKDGLCKHVVANGKSDRLYLEYPQTPVPENIKSFYITISHFDAYTLDFLAKIKPLLTDVQIELGCIHSNHRENQKNLQTILTILSPMLDGIPSVFCEDASTLSVVKNHQLFQDPNKLSKLNWLEFLYDIAMETEQQQEMVAFIINWLAQPDGPRLLDLCSRNDFFIL